MNREWEKNPNFVWYRMNRALSKTCVCSHTVSVDNRYEKLTHVAILFQWIMGFITFFFPGASASTRQSMVPWHAIFGLFIYILAVGNAQLGFIEKLTFLQLFNKLGKYGSEALLINFTALVVIFLGAAVVISTVNFKTTRLESQKSIGL